MRKQIGQGAHSKVFIDDEEPGIAIKEYDGKDSGYLPRQKDGYDIINNIKRQNADTGVMLPELVEMNTDGNKQIIKEKMIPGEEFHKDPKKYFSLSEEQKNNIAKQMAIFLNAMHSSYECKPATESIKNMTNGKLNNADEIITKFAGTLPKNISDRLKQAEEYLSTSDISNEFIVMTHKDLRDANIMYDEKTGKIAVIDFELAGMGNVYRDFVPYSTSTSMPWDFTKRVIKYYNNIPNKKYPITIDPKKVQNMLFYGLLCEIARATSPQEMQKTTKEQVFALYKTLETVSGINPDTKSAFEKGIQEIKKMQPDNQQLSMATQFNNLFQKD